MLILILCIASAIAFAVAVSFLPGFAERHSTVRVVHLYKGEEVEASTVQASRAAVFDHVSTFPNPTELRIYGTRRALRRIGCTGPHQDLRGEHFDFDHPAGWTYAYVVES